MPDPLAMASLTFGAFFVFLVPWACRHMVTVYFIYSHILLYSICCCCLEMDVRTP
jgi:hypothetical protein